MARQPRLDVLRAILDTGLVPTFLHEQEEVAVRIAAALVDGGARVLEFLDRGTATLPTFAAVARWRREQAPEVALGIGSIVDPPTAALFLAHGADFVVGPTFHPRMARLCNRRKVAYIPGCVSPSEISAAEELGCEIVKLFPSSALNGPEFIRSLRGPMPWSRVMPTGNGVQFAEENVREWVAAGACALGTGGALVEPALVAAADWSTLAQRTRTLLSWIRAARGPGEGRARAGRGA